MRDRRRGGIHRIGQINAVLSWAIILSSAFIFAFAFLEW
jgi:hypothetical protein